MKLVIQIPCLDEAATLAATMGALPARVDGFDVVEVVVIDDGSRDGTAALAAELGAHVIRLPATRGLARAFRAGIDTCLRRGADVIVNTDGDNQYRGADVATLVAPIVRGNADMVIGARPIATIAAFSPVKKLLQCTGSWLVRWLTGTDVADAPSGFRAFSRETALGLNVFSTFTYTLETIVQASQRGLRVSSVPVQVNTVDRPSRLARGTFAYLWQTGTDLLRILVVYRPFRSFMLPALVLYVAGTAIGVRFLWKFVESGGAAGHLQSLILAAILFGLAAMLTLVAFVGGLLAINRRVLEELQLDARRARFRSPGDRPEPD